MLMNLHVNKSFLVLKHPEHGILQSQVLYSAEKESQLFHLVYQERFSKVLCFIQYIEEGGVAFPLQSIRHIHGSVQTFNT